MKLIKSRLLLFSLLLGVVVHSQAQTVEFDRSVELLQNDDHRGAIIAMDSIISQGQVSPKLYSNLANAHFNQGNKAEAILYYEKALVMDPRNSDILNAITAIRKQLNIQITNIPDFILVSYYRNIVNLFSASVWSTLQLLTGIIAITLLFLYMYPRENELMSIRNIKILGISAFIVSMLLLVFAHSKKNYELGGSQGIVMESNISIHQAPDKLSPEVAPIGEGNKVFIISELGKWYKVSLRDKDLGWIKKEEVVII